MTSSKGLEARGDKIGDEYHVLLECKNISIMNLRQKHLPIYFLKHLFMYKLITLLKSEKQKEIIIQIGCLSKKSMYCILESVLQTV